MSEDEVYNDVPNTRIDTYKEKQSYRYKFTKPSDKPLQAERYVCPEPSCRDEIFYTKNKLAEHHLAMHSSIPLDLKTFKAEEHVNGFTRAKSTT